MLLPPANEVCEGYVFTCVCPRGGGWYPSMPCRWYPSMPCRSPGGCVSQHALQVSRPTPKGELEGSGRGGLQAHTDGGSPGPHLGGGFSRHTPGGGFLGAHLGGLQAHTRGVSRPTWGVYPSMHRGRTPPPADGHCCGRCASYWNAFLLINLWSS